MAAVGFNPFWEFQNAMRNLGKYMSSEAPADYKPRVEVGDFKPRVDITEDDNALYFDAEIPGVKKDDIKVSVNEHNILSIKGEKKFDREKDVKTCCRNERSYGEFARSFQLPDNVNSDDVKANYEKGILTLKIAKKEPEKPKEKEVSID